MTDSTDDTSNTACNKSYLPMRPPSSIFREFSVFQSLAAAVETGQSVMFVRQHTQSTQSKMVLRSSLYPPRCVKCHEGHVVLLRPRVKVCLRQRHGVHAISVQVLLIARKGERENKNPGRGGGGGVAHDISRQPYARHTAHFQRVTSIKLEVTLTSSTDVNDMNPSCHSDSRCRFVVSHVHKKRTPRLTVIALSHEYTLSPRFSPVPFAPAP